jgi:hypothetical protein
MIGILLDPACKASEQQVVIWDFVFLWADIAKERP